MPDTYQGAALLAGLRPVLEDGPEGDAGRRDAVPRLLAGWPSGAVKLYVLARALHHRRALDPLFPDGDYLPLDAAGQRSNHVIAYARTRDERFAVTVVARLPAALLRGTGRRDRVWAPPWGVSALRLPDALHDVPPQNVLTGEALSARDAGSLVPLRDLLGRFPVALLEPADRAASGFGGRSARDREVPHRKG